MNLSSNILNTAKRLLHYIVVKRKLLFSLVVACILISSSTVVISSIFLEVLIDDYITPLLTDSNPDFKPLLFTIIFMGFIYLFGVLSTFIYNRVMVKISQGTLKDIRDDMFKHMQSLPIKYFDTNTHGDIMSHYTNDTDTLRQFISQSLPQFISSFVTIVVILVFMLINSLPLTILVIFIAVLMALVTKKVGTLSARYFIKQQETLGDVTGYIEEMINGQKVIKVFCHEEEAKINFDSKNIELCSDSTQANKFSNILMPTIMQLGNLQYILIALVGGCLALSGIGSISIGMIVAFLNLSKTFCMPVSQIAQQTSMVAMALAGAERIFELIDEDSEKDGGHISLKDKKIKGEVEFKNVDFGYSEDKLVLHDISLVAKPGQKIAFVGATGAGKTTITNLINRFYDINSGTITYDKMDISTINKRELRKSLGIVLQDVNLFTGTIMENIRYGRLDASDEECINASKLANAHEFISKLPDGYDTLLVQNGSGLSQGQRQLISIARAAVADPPVMILDEATSSIDTRTEKLVQDGMDNLMKNRTVFVIAHRLSTVRNSDKIIVLDQGRIIESGTHDELIESQGTYYRLYTGAFELE